MQNEKQNKNNLRVYKPEELSIYLPYFCKTVFPSLNIYSKAYMQFINVFYY